MPINMYVVLDILTFAFYSYCSLPLKGQFVQICIRGEIHCKRIVINIGESKFISRSQTKNDQKRIKRIENSNHVLNVIS